MAFAAISETSNPESPTATNPSIDLALNSDEFANDMLTGLGYASVSGLSSTWDAVTSQLIVSFNSAQNETVSVREYLTPISIDLYIDKIVEDVFTESGYSSVYGLSSSWDTNSNSIHVTYSRAYAGGYFFQNGDTHITVNNEGDIISYSSTAYNSTVGTITVGKGDLTSSDKSIIKSGFQNIKSLENIIDSITSLNTKEAITEIALEVVGITNVKNLALDWDGEHKTSIVTMDSATDDGVNITDVKLTISTSNYDSIDYYSSVATVNGIKVYGDRYDLNDTEEYVIEEAHKAIDRIESAVANHSFTNGNLTFSFNTQGNLSDFSSTIRHSDVGIISTTENNLTTSERSSINHSYFTVFFDPETSVQE
ncbi:MAG: hypothetical protein ABGY08_11475, partial [Gammaproteobacteria bacterium]